MKLTPEQFVYWLQGFVELHGISPTTFQWEIIKAHLQAVFDKKIEVKADDLSKLTSSPYVPTPLPVKSFPEIRWPDITTIPLPSSPYLPKDTVFLPPGDYPQFAPRITC